MSRPIVVDVDGTMSRADRSIEGRVIDALRAWSAPVVIATGKAFPYPVALCDFIGVPVRIIAENGGVVCAEGTLTIHGDADAARRAAERIEAAGYDLGWAAADLVNRWRETEVAVGPDVPRAVVDDAAAAEGLEVVDSGFAYHVKSSDVSKGTGLLTVADLMGLDARDFAAIGDSENDVSTFEVVGASYAVANAYDPAKSAADRVTAGRYADGLLEAMAEIAGG
jgi:phosphoglycolate phosphatase (TIGR01487 family)